MLVHDELNLYGQDDHFVHEARVTITHSDGAVTVVNSLVAIDRAPDGRLASWRVYSGLQAEP